jgi:hypothetical protein
VPKAGKSIDVYLSGSGFVNGSQVWVCGPPNDNPPGRCFSIPLDLTVMFNSGQIGVPVTWSATLAYIKVVNPDGRFSLFRTLQFVP